VAESPRHNIQQVVLRKTHFFGVFLKKPVFFF